jgi:hypothetical protein
MKRAAKVVSVDTPWPGVRVLSAIDWSPRDIANGRLRLSFNVSGSAESLIAAGLLCQAMLDGLPACGIKSYKDPFGEKQAAGNVGDWHLSRRKAVCHVRIAMFAGHPRLAELLGALTLAGHLEPTPVAPTPCRPKLTIVRPTAPPPGFSPEYMAGMEAERRVTEDPLGSSIGAAQRKLTDHLIDVNCRLHPHDREHLTAVLELLHQQINMVISAPRKQAVLTVVTDDT